MSHNSIRVWFIAVAVALTGLTFGPPTLLAQAIPDPLGPIVAEALRNNLGIAQERLATERAGAGVREARGRFFPSLSLDSRYSEQSGTLNLGNVVNPAYAALNQVIGEHRFPTNLDLTLPQTHESRLRLTQPVFDASVSAGFALSRHTRDAQGFQQQVVARQLAAQAQTAYLNVATARSARRTWEATLDLVTESERVAGRLVEAGRATPDAVFRARADRSDVERLLEARDDEDAAARAFNQLLRRPLGTSVDALPDSLLRFEIRLTEDEAIERAFARREELAQTTAGIQAAEAGVRLATASFKPNVALALDYGVQGQNLSFSRDADFAVASVVLSWNLFNGGQDVARRQGRMPSDSEFAVPSSRIWCVST